MNSLSLFSGAGGGLLAEKYILNWRSIGYVEYNTYCQKVIAQRIKDGFLDEAPIFGDINGFIESGAAKKYKGFVDVVTGGFPCQPFSVAGKRKAQDDSRNLWPQTLTVLCDVRPRFALLENVPGLLSVNGGGYFAQILADLAESGFDARWCVLGADDVGAPHRRKRLWILAYPNNQRSHGIKSDDSLSKVERREPSIRSEDRVISKMGSPDHKGSGDVANTNSTQLKRGGVPIRVHKEDPKSSGGSSDAEMAYAERIRQQGSRPSGDAIHSEASGEGETVESINGSGQDLWSVEPNVGRVAHGVASRVDRLKAIGNGQVPLVATTAWKLLSGQELESI